MWVCAAFNWVAHLFFSIQRTFLWFDLLVCVSLRRLSAFVFLCLRSSAFVCVRQHLFAFVCVRLCSSAFVCVRFLLTKSSFAESIFAELNHRILVGRQR